MAKPEPYSGHHCWNCWNVSLRIDNRESLYLAAIECCRRPRTSGKPVTATIAALRFDREVIPFGSRTPDRAKYTFKAVRAWMEEQIESDKEESAAPLCAQAMGCLCAAHAKGRSSRGPCDAREDVNPAT